VGGPIVYSYDSLAARVIIVSLDPSLILRYAVIETFGMVRAIFARWRRQSDNKNSVIGGISLYTRRNVSRSTDRHIGHIA